LPKLGGDLVVGDGGSDHSTVITTQTSKSTKRKDYMIVPSVLSGSSAVQIMEF
jgi:hypothetical protein